MMELVDTHCHLNFDAYASDLDAVLEAARAVGVTRFIVPAIDLETSAQVVALAERFEGVYAAVGIHPNSTANYTPQMLDDLRRLLPHPKVVAVGEIGLDYYWNFSPHSLQQAAFEAQLALANEFELPVIIHNRDAHEATLDTLSAWQPIQPQRPGVLHSFSGDNEHAARALALGFYLGFTGPVTYKKAETTRAVAAQVPLDRILVETDSPYLTPVPHRGKRNSPAYIPYIVQELARVRHTTELEIAQASTENALRLFNLPV
jgi:TatD DNase family protein